MRNKLHINAAIVKFNPTIKNVARGFSLKKANTTDFSKNSASLESNNYIMILIFDFYILVKGVIRGRSLITLTRRGR